MAKNNSRDSYNRILSINGVQYKLNRLIDKTETDIHHFIGNKYRMKYNTNEEENKVRISRREHIALNNFFGDKQSPREQLLKVFNLIKSVLSPGVRNELYTILELTDDEMFYIPNVLKCLKQKNKKKSEQNWTTTK